VLGIPQADLGDVIHACQAAGIHDTIQALPQGYQSPIGEHGAGLSGGQKQRVAIARALLKRPKVLVFNEATSNLDEESAQGIARTIQSLRGHVTIVMIAHALPAALGPDATYRLSSPLEDAQAVARNG